MTLVTAEAVTAASFSSLPLADFLKETIRTVGYTTPTPIQAQSIPLACDGHDLIGLAQTGTGKTAAFVLPILNKLSGSKERGVRALILAPTRELAEQINDVIKLFCGRTGLKSCTVYGGVSHRNQVSALRSQPAIVVACPGRLKDHMQGDTIDLSKVECLVLDEADRMLDMGFLPDIKQIVREIPTERQTLLFSATMPSEIEALTKQILRDPKIVRVQTESPVATVSHAMYALSSEDKMERLRSWLSANPQALTVVFTKMKHTAKRLSEKLSGRGIEATSLHGNLSQAQRTRALSGFKDGTFRVLIATDIAARGIDVDGITHVLNYDMPETLDAYIHRTGRAGRASRSGQAVSFVTRGDRGILRDVERWLKAPLEKLNSAGIEGAEGDDQQIDLNQGEVSERPERQARGRGRNERGPRGGARGGRSGRFGGRDRAPSRGDRRDRADRGERRARPEGQEGSEGAPREERSEGRFGNRSNFRGDRGARGGRSDRNDRGGRNFQSRGRFERSDRPFGRRPAREGDSEARPEGEGAERSTSERSFERRGRGFEGRGRPQRSGAERREGRSGGGFRGGRKFDRNGDRPARDGGRPQRAFRGQKDIDPNSDYVYKPAPSHTISTSGEAGEGRGRGRFGRGGRSGGSSRPGGRPQGRGFRRQGGRSPRAGGARESRPPRTTHYD